MKTRTIAIGCDPNAASLISDAYSAERAAKSNNANIITLGAFTVGVELAKLLVKVYLQSQWSTGTLSEAKVQRYVDYDRQRGKSS